ALKDTKPKEREDVSDREAVRKMRRYIEKLTSDKYGYTYDEVSEMLKGLGIHLSGSRIKYLLGELKKSSRRQKKNQRETTTTELVVSEVDSEPVNSTKGKRKNQEQTKLSSEPEAEPHIQSSRQAFTPKIYSHDEL
ncbi:hypothetical protein VB735_31700, partial [Halotia wernerae UHCC 0503]|nr:hypothetical protein [Halotia wernerae UHCC 0503]